MSTPFSAETRSLEHLSALADGELDSAAATVSCEAWRADPQAQASWHAYHLIGDVLRSDDLAVDPGHDAAFLQKLRARLESEPVVFAPGLARQASEAAGRLRTDAGRPARRWLASGAMAAGFMLVVGMVVLGRPDPHTPGASPVDGLAGNTAVPAAPAGERRVAQAVPAESAQYGMAEGRNVEGIRAVAAGDQPVLQAASTGEDLIRDPRLDRYLAAHKQFAGSSALGVPSAFLRSATVPAPRR